MGGVIGALSTKIAFTAGALLFASRVDTQRTPAAIDPSLPATTIAEPLAQRIGGTAGAQRHSVDIGSSTIRISGIAIAGWLEPPMTIGTDVLQETALSIDLRQMRLQVMDDSQVRRATRGRAPIGTSIASDKCVTVEATSAEGKPIKAALVNNNIGQRSVRIALGGMPLMAVQLPTGRCEAGDVALGWSSFAGKTVLLDLGHNRLWIW